MGTIISFASAAAKRKQREHVRAEAEFFQALTHIPEVKHAFLIDMAQEHGFDMVRDQMRKIYNV